MTASRVFVRGLPPNINEQEFRSHFSKRYVVTDVRLMLQRRIGYVGFRTSEDAHAAVKYFNKSFYRMSKLHVELAQGISKNLEAPTTHVSKKTAREARVLKRKHEDADTPQLQSKAPPSPSKAESHESEVEEISKIGDKHEATSSKAVVESTEPEQHEKESSPVPAQDEASHVAPKSSDTDWMRTRTSRLLGLVEDDDPMEGQETQASTELSRGDGAYDGHTGSASTQPDRKVQNGIHDKQEEAASEPGAAEHSQSIARDGRLFLRNLSFEVCEDDIKDYFQPMGTVKEVQVPRDFKSGKPKGFAFVEFQNGEDAIKAVRDLDGTTFQGRLLHILPAFSKRGPQLDEFSLAQLPLKKRRLVERKQLATSSTFNWNFMYMNIDAVLSSTASRLGIPKSELLDPTSSDAAVKQAQAETHSIEEARWYFRSVGVNLDSLNKTTRDGNSILVKNFKHDTSAEDLQKLFQKNGNLSVRRVLLPPGGTIAIIELANQVQASAAMREFAYRKHNDSILFLERGPSGLFYELTTSDMDVRNASAHANLEGRSQIKDGLPKDEDALSSNTTTLFVRNLNFITTTERLREEFKPLEGLMSCLVKTRPDPKDKDKTLSMGFGFLEFDNKDHARAALSAMNGHMLDGHVLEVRLSNRGRDAAEERRREDQMKRQRDRTSKLAIKNLPFEASKKDVRNLLRSYGQLRALRMPKKFNGSTRGYAFAQFKTPKEAENAMDALRSTHLLGRRLVLEYAADEVEDPEQQIERMQEKVGKQSHNVALQKLTAVQRQKLNLDSSNEAGAN